MARPRKDKFRRLPKGAYFTGGRYVYREYLGAGKFAPDRRLCGKEASEAQVWIAYNELLGVERGQTLRKLFDLFMASPRWPQRSNTTRRHYSTAYGAICATPVDGRAFGDIPYAAITRGAVQGYVDFKGKTAPVQANRHLAAMSAAFKWGASRDMVTVNPCHGVIRFAEKGRRDLYVVDADYQAAYEFAAGEWPRIQACMELAYLCRLREIEIVKLTRRDERPDGLLAERVKGSKTQVIGLTERLQDALRAAKALSDPPNAVWLVPAQDGGKLTPGGFRTEWQRFRKWCRETHGYAVPFTFHDLKAKGVSDFDGSKKLAGGHRTESAAAVYDRRLETVPATR